MRSSARYATSRAVEPAGAEAADAQRGFVDSSVPKRDVSGETG